MTAHNIILKKLSETSEAYTYIENLLRDQDGRVDILALIFWEIKQSKFIAPGLQEREGNII